MTTMHVAADRYTSREHLALELDRVFAQVWLLAIHASELGPPGTFAVFEIAGESILITHAPEGDVRAFYNVCQHRGTRLCETERGTADSFRCPYHHWEYGLDGRLLKAPGAGLAARGPTGEAIGLAPLACEERFGFVWISMAKAPVDIDTFLAPVAPVLARYRPQEFRLETENIVEVAANWKASVDVNNESYHLPTLHPSLLEVADVHASRYLPRGDHSLLSLPLGRPSRAVEPDAPVGAPLRELLGMLGIMATVERVADVRPAIAQGFRARAAELGVDLSELSDEELATKQQVHILPNVQLNFLPFSLQLYRHRPHPSEPGRCWFDELSFVRPGTGPAPAPQRYRFLHGERRLGPIMDADVDLLPRLQAGMRSRGFSTLRLTVEEESIAHMHASLDRWLAQPEER